MKEVETFYYLWQNTSQPYCKDEWQPREPSKASGGDNPDGVVRLQDAYSVRNTAQAWLARVGYCAQEIIVRTYALNSSPHIGGGEERGRTLEARSWKLEVRKNDEENHNSHPSSFYSPVSSFQFYTTPDPSYARRGKLTAKVLIVFFAVFGFGF